MPYKGSQRGIVWRAVSTAAALALAVGLMPSALAFAGDADEADEDLVVTSEPTLDEEAAQGASLQTQEDAGTGQGGAKDVYIDNTVDNSRAYVSGAVEVTDQATGEKTSVVVYSDSVAVSYTQAKESSRTSEVSGMLEEAVQAVIKYAKDNGYEYDEYQMIGPDPANGTAGKSWDNRKYTTVEDGDAVLIGDSDYLQGAYGVPTNDGYTRTHIASGDYGMERYYSITLKASAEKIASAVYDSVAGDGGSWTKGDDETLGFTFKREADDELTFMNFTGIKVDGNDVPSSDYTAKAGSVVLALSASYLETLSAGNHELTALFNDGVGTASFEVKAAASMQEEAATEPAATKASAAISSSASDVLPATGDRTLAIAVTMVFVAICATAVSLYASRKRAL
ncbi:MAG: hypothetical protein IJ111_12505 [Eggerthellaceae bacterium]|nr:hypothetical protein [Eggerthellaceae bacterium]